LASLEKNKEDWSKRLDLAQQADIAAGTVVRERGALEPSTSSAPSAWQPDPDRKRRWDKLNEILLANKKKHKSTGTSAYSYVSWNEVELVLPTVIYEQTVKPIPDDVLEVLESYLEFASKSFGMVLTGKKAKRIHFIAPIIVCVSYLFGGDVVIEAEQDLNGELVKAHGHFEFVLRRGNKRVCIIIEAKRDDMEQRLAQDLVGCELASEHGRLDVVYGIVTNYLQ
jgi:hypothetical protein